MPGRNTFLLVIAIALIAAVACGSSRSDGEAPSSAPILDSAVNVIDEAALEEFARLASAQERAYDERFFNQAMPPGAIVRIYEPKFVEQGEIEIWPGEMVMGVRGAFVAGRARRTRATRCRLRGAHQGVGPGLEGGSGLGF